MDRIRLTKEFSFEMAHALEGYDGACSQIHGHSYRLFVTVRGVPCDDPSNPKYGMVMDFGALKKIVKETVVDLHDHAFVIRRTPSNGEFIRTLKDKFSWVIVTDYQPTCENMLSRFAASIGERLPEGVELFSLKMHETATSFAEWYAGDNAL